MKGFRKPLFLLLIILVLTAIAYWDEKQTVADKKITETKNRFLDFKPADLKTVRFERPGKPSIVLERQGDKTWTIREPVAYPADNEGIDRLLKTISELQFEKNFSSSKENLKEYGLDNPQIRLVLKDATKSWDLQIGAKSPVGYSSYVRLNDSNKVFLVSHYIFMATNKELSDFRDKSLHVPAQKDLTAITYHWQGEADIQLVKKDNHWNLEKPAVFPADASEVGGFLDLLNRQKIVSFIDSPVPELRKALTQVGKGSTRVVSVFFTHTDGKQSSFELIENNGRLYTKLPIGDSFAEIDNKGKEELHKKMADFQNRNMFSFNATDVKAVEIDGKHYVKREDKWVNEKDQQHAEFVRGLLADLEFAKADVALSTDDGLKATKGPPQYSVIIATNDGKSTSISLWKNLDQPEIMTVKVGEGQYFRAKSGLFESLQSKDTPPALGLGEQPKSKS